MAWSKIKLIAKKSWVWAKKFWWAVVLGLLFVVVVLIGALTRNGAFLAGLLDMMEARRQTHNEEIETLERIHGKEVNDKNARLKEYARRRAEIEEEFKKRGESLDKQKEDELKRLIDQSYNNPEKLARELAKAFGINENG